MDRTPFLSFLRTAVASALVTCCVAMAAGAGQQPPAAPVFTVQQADAGKAAYAKSCASCHMPDLSGSNEIPALAGTTFVSTWGTRSTKDLFDYISASMPYGGASLTPEVYTTIAAYILQSNGGVAGERAYSATTAIPISSVTRSRTTSAAP